MRKILFVGFMVLILSLAVFGSAAAAGNGQSELAQIRKVTAKYHDESVAIADGYTPTDINATIPGFGTMGLHYINFAELADPSINPGKPEVLLYVPSNDGKDGVRLVGVEYVVAGESWTVDGVTFEGWNASEPPSIFGQKFEGPMPGHAPGEPIHYDKHIWLWQANPKGFNIEANGDITYHTPGIFSQWNPNLK
jgi:hypothetical protein